MENRRTAERALLEFLHVHAPLPETTIIRLIAVKNECVALAGDRELSEAEVRTQLGAELLIINGFGDK